IRASAEQKLAVQSLKALDEHNFSNVLAANFEKAKATQNAASTYQNSILPEWQKVQDLTDRKFNGGQASVLDLWQIRTRITDVKAEALQARLDAIDAQITLETFIGQTLSNKSEETE
ncbi:MAG: TolC family protein, partial [Alphaproteobacteria bacterium]|nr:TolC family protein [Alphaproteobacteria bacterium]